jgi:hypothetical protein
MSWAFYTLVGSKIFQKGVRVRRQTGPDFAEDAGGEDKPNQTLTQSSTK